MHIDSPEHRGSAMAPPPINWATRPVPSTCNSCKNLHCLADEPAANTARPSAVIADVKCAGNSQDDLRSAGDSIFSEPNCNLTHLLRHLGHSRFRQPRTSSRNDASFDGCNPSSGVQNLASAFAGLSTLANPTSSGSLTASLSTNSRNDPSLDGRDPSSEVQNLASAFAGLSTSTNPTPIGSLAARTTQVPDRRQHQPSPFRTVVLQRTSPLALRTVPLSASESGMSSPIKKRYYGILVGKCTGVYYDEWDNVLPLVKHVPDAHYQGFSTHKVAQEYYLGAKALNKVRIVRNPSDDEIYGLVATTYIMYS
ncbi:uncharacterized protein LACBIDRAFT_330707 [Laccaria bicolor S238N-H82]|uniref:Predicted protein n=1 Tax=Laccaria bicolor (strain S238N-H82 / ATCC MYA-4686) TaxID=486041 RepID=B0DM66_LACBS|nr:uncharacterized protein LACBIDRAFT_330707 [Laccaria bicolor S238N-H82]EDR04140.1 predicted protein [Laccaria bicolor S238N-H82]|eukprot:XP_001885031.1 predicted protein [Laccaria bicolor S238N-H82]